MSGGRVLPLETEVDSVSTCYPRVVFQRNMLYAASEWRRDEARPI